MAIIHDGRNASDVTMADWRWTLPPSELARNPHLGPSSKARLVKQHTGLRKVLAGRGVTQLTPEAQHGASGQVFTRDPCFAIGERLFIGGLRDEWRHSETIGLSDIRARCESVIDLSGDGATIEGGDVMVLGSSRRVLVGLSRHTNAAGFQKLSDALPGPGSRCRARAARGPPSRLLLGAFTQWRGAVHGRVAAKVISLRARACNFKRLIPLNRDEATRHLSANIVWLDRRTVMSSTATKRTNALLRGRVTRSSSSLFRISCASGAASDAQSARSSGILQRIWLTTVRPAKAGLFLPDTASRLNPAPRTPVVTTRRVCAPAAGGSSFHHHCASSVFCRGYVSFSVAASYRRPFFMTSAIFAEFLMSSSGLASSTRRSASLPASSDPRSSRSRSSRRRRSSRPCRRRAASCRRTPASTAPSARRCPAPRRASRVRACAPPSTHLVSCFACSGIHVLVGAVPVGVLPLVQLVVRREAAQPLLLVDIHPVGEPSGRRLPAAEPDATLLHEAVVLPEQQVLLHLRHRVERHADDDQQRRAAELERHVDQSAMIRPAAAR